MVRGLSVEKFIYLLFHAPFTCQTCAVSAYCGFASLPFNVDMKIAFQPSSPVDVMHTANSLLISALGFLLFGPSFSASAVFPRQASEASPSIYNTRFPSVTWDNDLWRVTTTALDQGHYQSRQSVANGYFGMFGARNDLNVMAYNAIMPPFGPASRLAAQFPSLRAHRIFFSRPRGGAMVSARALTGMITQD